MNSKRVEVELGARSYPIFISEDFQLENFEQTIGQRRFYVITDSHVAPLYGDQLSVLPNRLGQSIVPAGESSKSLQQAEIIYGDLIRAKADRKTVIVALGGGVVGDLAGFIASTYMRGVPFVQMPTSLLAMVDSSVGGKVAVNHPLGKNMIGHFYQPESVLMATSVLKTLPQRELQAGMAEVIKYGIIMDAEFFAWLEQNVEKLLALDPQAIASTLEKSVCCKAQVVGEDEKEGGVRATLNLGHTFGHAEEVLAGYGRVLHGEAVAAGMVAAMATSVALGQASEDDLRRCRALILKFKLPITLTQSHRQTEFWTAMEGDKKSLSGVVNFVLSRGIGGCDLPKAIQRTFIENVLTSLR
jgi:3-dehydroquinate synthase